MTPERIQRLMDYKNMSIAGLEKEARVGNATIRRCLKADRNISHNIANKILSANPKISPLWFLNGEGSMFKLYDGKAITIQNQILAEARKILKTRQDFDSLEHAVNAACKLGLDQLKQPA